MIPKGENGIIYSELVLYFKEGFMNNPIQNIRLELYNEFTN